MGNQTGGPLGLRHWCRRSEDRRRSQRTAASAGPGRVGDAGDEPVAGERLRDPEIDEGLLWWVEARSGTRRSAAAREAGDDATERDGASVLLGELHSIR